MKSKHSLIYMSFHLFLGILVTSCTLQNKTSSNAFIAHMSPISNIVIDADLADWPAHQIKNPLTLVDGALDGTDSSKSYFMVGYQAKDSSLLFGVYFEDDIRSIDPAKDWKNQDSYSFYIDEEHNISGSGVIRISFNEEFMVYSNPEISWDPNIKALFNTEKLTKTIRTDKNGVTVEFKYQLSKSLNTGDAIGINHMFTDVDLDHRPQYYTWVGNEHTHKTARKLGSVILVNDDLKTSEIKGKLVPKDSSFTSFPSSLVIGNTKCKSLWANVPIDSTGAFQVALPYGSYDFRLNNDLVKIPDGYAKITLDSETKSIVVNQDSENFRINYSEIELPNLIPEVGLLVDGLSDQDMGIIDEFVNTYRKHYNIPGVQLSVIVDSKIAYSKAYGFSNYYTKEPLHLKTIMEGASMTKPMFAFAVMRLVERGIVDLDRPLYLDADPPGDLKENPWYKLITPRKVLSHRTGLPNWAEDTPDGKLFFKFKPGTGVGYSGAGFTYLRRAVENITNKSIDELMHEEVVEVLQLNDTYFQNQAGLAEITAHGHLYNDPRIKDIPEYAEMASSVHTNSDVYANFLLATFRREGLDENTYQQMIRPIVRRATHIEQGKECHHYYGLGWSLRDSPFFGLSYGHSGSNGDFKCTSTIYKRNGNGFVVMTNGYTGQMLQYHLHNLLNIGTMQVDP